MWRVLYKNSTLRNAFLSNDSISFPEKKTPIFSVKMKRRVLENTVCHMIVECFSDARIQLKRIWVDQRSESNIESHEVQDVDSYSHTQRFT